MNFVTTRLPLPPKDYIPFGTQYIQHPTEPARLAIYPANMHPHLHTKDNVNCADVMNALDECHAKGFLWKSMGMCTEAKYAVNMCLRAERLKRTEKNREVAREKRQKYEKIWAEIDANS